MTRSNLPGSVLARWKAEDWDEETMTASRYEYVELGETESGNLVQVGPIELTEEEASRYYWGQTEDNDYGGCQRGTLARIGVDQ
jgi:hypothetical protein